MADRIHSYSMFPPNLTSNSLQQPQIPRQPQQSQQPDPQMIPALSNPEHGRIWQQMNQLQNAYRPQQSSDLAASQMNHQMQDFTRGQALSHGQGQPIVQQIQQSFGLNAQRVNPPVFHDPQAGQQQSIIPSGFSNVPMNTQQQMKAPFNMNPMIHGLNNPGLPRQLKMLNPQEVARLHQSGLGTQHAPSQSSAVDMFVSPALQPSQDQMHGSPHPTAQPVGPPGPSQGMVPGNSQQNVQKRMITPVEFQERRGYLLSMITQSENKVKTLIQTARNSGSADPHIQQQINQYRAELASRQDVYTKFVATFGAMVTQQMANGIPPSNMPHMNPMTHSTPQPPQQATVQNAQVQPGFVTQANQPITAQYGIPAGSGSSPLPTQSQGALNQQIPIQSTQIGRPSNVPPRTGGTPHQIPGSQLSNAIPPIVGNFTAQGGQKVPNQTRQPAVMPLDKQRFDSTYTLFCRSQNTNPVVRVAIGENRTVDLHQLHVYVMQEGGAQSVTLRDMWTVIGGRLGFTQFPGNDTEPARCGPALAQQLHNTYEHHLRHFENAYVLTVRNRSVAEPSQQPIHQMSSNPLTAGNNASPGMSGNPTEVSANPSHTYFNQQLLAAAVRYAHMSVQDMRAQRVQENVITFVERRRPELQKVYQQQVQVLAKRNAEQEQQNMANTQTQLSNMHEQPPIGLPLQRSVGANTVVNMPPGDPKVANGPFVHENTATAPHKQPPTQDQIQQAQMTIHQIKHMFQQRLSGMTPSQIPDEQRMEYSLLLEEVYKMTADLDPRLHMYLVVFRSDDLLRRFVAIVLTVARQRQLLSTTPPQYIINLSTLRNMQTQIQKLNEEFENRWRAMKAPAVNVAANSPQHASLAPTHTRLNPAPSLTVPPVQNTPQIASSATQINGRPVSINSSPQPPQPQPSPSHSHLHPPPPPQSHSQPSQLQPHFQQPQPNKKSLNSSIPPSPSAPPASVSLASSTPPPAAASSSTPATSAPTPQTAAGSPQTPKSPASKTVTKTKTANRANRRLSTAGKGSATPETAPSVVGVKRAPEEDVATLTSVAPSEAEASNAPSPKKAKTEWEGETSEALLKKQQELSNIKTEEDTAAFFDRMKEFFAMSASTDEEIHHDIASTLDQILAGVAQEPADAAATAAALSIHGTGDTGPPPTALSPHMGPANEAFLEFIDFSSFTTLEDEDNDSKAPTPDLVPSSETNPSPESGSEGELLGGTGSHDRTKIEEASDRSDPLRLGPFKEIDGGESACYQVDNWKWEGSMIEQQWAFLNS